ncbi:MAG TPA: inorganic diphosphatase [Polyangia bacterium]|nr:inorganic diphosphatase [Polyangia bacterium]
MPKALASRVPVPIELAACTKEKGEEVLHVVIETARGGRNKMAYDEALGVFRLKTVLPEGMSFPRDFGFVPSTEGDDGDPVDALVLMDEPGTTGCLVACRLIGVILGEQGEKGKRIRNDRLLAVAIPSHTHGDLEHVDDLNRNLLEELETFFVNYHSQYGETYRVLGCKGPRAAWKLVKEGERRWKKR